MRVTGLLATTSLFLFAACGGTDGAEVGAEACTKVECPAGTAPNMSAEADTSCSGDVSVDRGVTSLGAEAGFKCFGSGACTLVCEPPAPCCGGEVWGADSYTCETPCAASTCAQVTCPAGTAPSMTAGNETSCADGTLPEGAADSAACIGSEECAIVCEPVSQCCGGEAWTSDSYTCETPCSGACSCDDKCGTVTGVDCTAECGGCEGGQICSADNVCVDACAGEVVSCGGACCGTGELCYQNLCCDPVTNCQGKSCGDDGCGGLCDTQEFVPGCEVGEVCDQTGQCAAGCACAGRCGLLVEAGCEADCGSCDAGLVCSADNLCVDTCAGGGVACGGDCCGSTEVCFQNLCCDPVANCTGKSCGTDGCGGECEAQDSIPGCSPGETCEQDGSCGSCAGSIATCTGNNVQACEPVDGTYTWIQIPCTSLGQYCFEDAVGAECVDCLTAEHCDDGDPCTSGDACGVEHTCLETTPTICSDGDPCNGEETCDSEIPDGCVAGTPPMCDDGDVCNGEETCDPAVDGGCVSGEAPQIDDGFACTTDGCDPVTGAFHTADDDDCNDDNECTSDSCSPSSGCVFTPNTEDCDDGLDCTGGDVCEDGVCAPSYAISFQKTIEPSAGWGDPVVARNGDGVLVLHTNASESYAATWYDGLGNKVHDCDLVLVGADPPDVARVTGAAAVPSGSAHLIVGSAGEWGYEDAFVAYLDTSCQLAPVYLGPKWTVASGLALSPEGEVAVVLNHENEDFSQHALLYTLNLDLDIVTETIPLGMETGTRFTSVRYIPASDVSAAEFVTVGDYTCNKDSFSPACTAGAEWLASVFRWNVYGAYKDSVFLPHTESLSQSSRTVAYDVVQPTDASAGGLVVVGTASNPHQTSDPLDGAWIGYVTEEMTLDWSHRFAPDPTGGASGRYDRVVQSTAKGGYFVAGTTHDSVSGYDPWLVHYDDNGGLQAATLFGIGTDDYLGDFIALDTGFAFVSRLNAANGVTFGAGLTRTSLSAEFCEE